VAGDGTYGGNGSVYWQVHHRSPTGPEPLKNKNKSSTNAKADHWVDLGVPGNIPAKTGNEVKGHDPTPVANISNGTGRFRVHLYFSGAAATNLGVDLKLVLGQLISDAYAQMSSLSAGNPDAHLVIEVPAVGRASEPTGTTSDPWEVSVSW
jgi:hypothetical protein